MASFPLRVLLYGSAARFQQNVWFRIIFVSDFTLLLTFVGNRRRSFSRITLIPLLTNKSLALFFVLLRKRRISLPTWWIFQIDLDPDIGYKLFCFIYFIIYIYIIIYIIDLNLNRSYLYLNCLRQFQSTCALSVLSNFSYLFFLSVVNIFPGSVCTGSGVLCDVYLCVCKCRMETAQHKTTYAEEPTTPEGELVLDALCSISFDPRDLWIISILTAPLLMCV